MGTSWVQVSFSDVFPAASSLLAGGRRLKGRPQEPGRAMPDTYDCGQAGLAEWGLSAPKERKRQGGTTLEKWRVLSYASALMGEKMVAHR